MKKVRILIIVFFTLTIIAFFGERLYERRTSDFTPPVISADTDVLEMSVNVTDDELLAGMTAIDNRDGDVTSTLVVASRSKFIRKNTVKVNYAAFDEDNNVGTYVRELVYTDYVHPRFSINGPMCYIESENRDVMQILKSITAYDCLDGDITSQIMITQGDVRTAAEGVQAQKVSLQVSNRSGDTGTLEFEVLFEDYNIFNQQRPHLSSYLIYTRAGRTPNLRSYADGVGYGNNVTSFADLELSRFANLDIDTSQVDFNTPGTYQVTFTLTRDIDKSGKQSALGSTIMLVVVEE